MSVLPSNAFVPLFHSSAGDDAVALSALCGLVLDDWQQEILRGLCSFDEHERFSARQALMLVPRQQGKAQAVNAPILTANRGWQTIGSLVPGDFVFRPDGTEVEVVGKSPVMVGNDCFRVTTTDGRSEIFDGDHLWTVTDKRSERCVGSGRDRVRSFDVRTLTTREMVESGLSRYAAGGRSSKLNGSSYATNEYRFVLPRQCSLQLEKADGLPVDPYLFGAWLGDGFTGKPQYITGAEDFEHWRAAWSEHYEFSINMASDGRARVFGVRGLLDDLRSFDMLGVKHVPDEYLLAGDRQREALLQGLMDSDGYVSASGQAEFCSTNIQLSESVLFLVRSLGWRAVFSEGRATLNGKDCGPKYLVKFTPKLSDDYVPFRLARKVARIGARDGGKGRFTVSIKSIEPVESVPVQCIKVADDAGLYLAGRDLIATHNTVACEARELAGLFLFQEKVMLHTAHEFRTAQSTFQRVREHIENGGSDLPFADQIGFRNSGAETSIRIPKIMKNGRTQHSGSYLQFTPRTSGAGRGLTVELLVVDEAYAYTPDQASALAFTQNQSKNPQSIVTSSTGFPDSEELIAMRNVALSGELSNLMYVEYKADDDCDSGDRDQWFKALPGLRTGRQRISEIEGHFAKAKASGDLTNFNREILGLWATNDIPSLIPAPLWESLTVDMSQGWTAPDEFAFGIAVTPADHSGFQRSVMYAAGRDENGFVHVWNVGDDDGTLWMPDFVKMQQEQRDPRVTVLDPMSASAPLVAAFDANGVQCTPLSSSQCMAACSQMEALIRDGRLRHGEDALLRDAVGSGVRRSVGHKGAWLWDPKNPGDDISAIQAATYAVFALDGVEAAGDKRTGGWW